MSQRNFTQMTLLRFTFGLAPTEIDGAFRSGTFLVKPAGALEIVAAVTKWAAGDQRRNNFSER
ncbi:hypothetical protein CK228_24665 [Mesorhizobium sp. WSM4312]|nr:hypothetical protein CK228_24665 [Mesorhizobium sp. WSM4312]PBC20074.1 hypothetical protein CK226_25190 [Mesorhizobium sp. WSM4311]